MTEARQHAEAIRVAQTHPGQAGGYYHSAGESPRPGTRHGGGDHGCERLIRLAHWCWLSQRYPDRRRRVVGINRADQLHVDRRAVASLATQPCDDLGDRMGSSINACRIR
jgi:hypothetical protein